jgi:hypothetical protein
MSVETRTWITGEEYNRECQRLIDAGVPDDDPRFVELRRHIDERNWHLWETYRRRLLHEHAGKYVAITPDGRVMLGERGGDLMWDAMEELGEDFALFRLSDPPHDRILAAR